VAPVSIVDQALQRVIARFAGAHPHRREELEHEDLTVTDRARSRRVADRLDNRLGPIVGYGDLELTFGT
jgi:hypothetical protein